MNLPEVIMLQRRVKTVDSMGGVTGDYTDLQPARACITPIREKTGLVNGGKQAVVTYKLVFLVRAFSDDHVLRVELDDRFVWQNNNDLILNIVVQNHKPSSDHYTEFEAVANE